MGSRQILSSGFDTARLLRARVFAPLGKAAASRPEGSERRHGGRIFHRRAAMSRARRPTSRPLSASRTVTSPLKASSDFCARPFVVKRSSRITQFRARNHHGVVRLQREGCQARAARVDRCKCQRTAFDDGGGSISVADQSDGAVGGNHEIYRVAPVGTAAEIVDPTRPATRVDGRHRRGRRRRAWCRRFSQSYPAYDRSRRGRRAC